MEIGSIGGENSIMVVVFVASQVDWRRSKTWWWTRDQRRGCGDRSNKQGSRWFWWNRGHGATEQVTRLGVARWCNQNSSLGWRCASVGFEGVGIKKTFPVESAKTIVVSLVPDGEGNKGFAVEIVVPGDEGLKDIETHASAKRRIGVSA
jgi:hypothetical protein